MSDYAGVAFIVVLIVGVATTSAASQWSIRQGYRHLGRLFAGVFVAPSVIAHEMCHLLVLSLLGYRIRGVDLGGAFNPRKAAQVRFNWNAGSPSQRLGLVFGAFAPVLIPCVALVVWHIYPYAPRGPWEWVAAGYTIMILSGAMGLSREDWSAATQGMFVFTPLIVLLGWLNPVGLFNAPIDAPWMSPITLTTGFALAGATAIQVTLGLLYTACGAINLGGSKSRVQL